MLKFSANLGYLWTDLELPAAVRAAAQAGFDAVECHWLYGIPTKDVKNALHDTGIPMVSLNTIRGQDNQFGLCALPDHDEQARRSIDQAIDYAQALDAKAVHVMAGVTSANTAVDVFCQNLTYACTRAADHNITILIEPLNRFDVPGYILETTTQATKIIETVQAANLKILFDYYHVERAEGDTLARLRECLPHICHIQVASVPDRQEPDHGDLDYLSLFDQLRDLNYHGYVGAEYRPSASSSSGLEWLADQQRQDRQ